MPSSFEEQFSSGDLVSPLHIKQVFPAIQDVESGQAFFRPDIGSANAYKVDFSEAYAHNRNVFSAYREGQLIVFKAGSANTGAATLAMAGTNLAGNPVDLGAKPLVKAGNVPLDAEDIGAGQIVVAVYNGAGAGRFEMLSAPAGGWDADEITSGEVSLEHGGTGADLSAAGPGFLYLNGEGDPVEAKGIDMADIGSGVLSLSRGGTGTDLSAAPDGFLHIFDGFTYAYSLSTEDLATGVLPMERGGTGQGAYSRGDLLVADGTELQRLVVGQDGDVLTADSSSQLGVSWKPLPGGMGSGAGAFFGNGSDGDVVLSSDTEIFENKYYRNLTVESGASLRTNGFKVYVHETLTLDGSIAFDGLNAEPSDGSTVGDPGAGVGGNINVDSAQGAPGSLSVGSDAIPQPPAIYFARGGDGGEGLAGAGGDGANEANVRYQTERTYRSLPAILNGISDGGLQLMGGAYVPGILRGGMGGAGGSGDGSARAGGSGGAGGGVIWVAARHLAGSGYLSANGGRGGDAGGPDAGGGGGGGAGVIYVMTSDSSMIYGWSLSGGQGGTGQAGGTDGAQGQDGLMIFVGEV